MESAAGTALALAHLHAAHALVELFEHLAFADDELKGVCLAAVERLAVDPALEVDRHAVGLYGALGRRPLRESAALLAQDVDCAVDCGLADFGAHTLYFHTRKIADLHVRVDLKSGVESQLALGASSFSCAIFGAPATRSFASVAASLKACPTWSLTTSYCTE